MSKGELTYEYTRRRRDFGRQLLLADAGPTLLDSLPCNPRDFADYILRNPVHQAQQNTRPMSEHFVNTIRAEYTTSGINHTEGGWPKDINTADPEALQRYRRKIEKDDAYSHCVLHLSHINSGEQQRVDRPAFSRPRAGPHTLLVLEMEAKKCVGMEHYILQNNAIDMYQTYYSEFPPLPPVERSDCRTVNVYRDNTASTGSRRPISALSWQADGGNKMAAAYADLDRRQLSAAATSNHSYIWDIENANAPELTLSPAHALLDLQYNPRDQHTLVGGLMSGQVAYWDARRGGSPAGVCSPHEAHRDPCNNVLYINSKAGTEFFSSSPDGQCKWWDTRNMSAPTDTMVIDPVSSVAEEQCAARALGVSVLEYEPTIPTRFMVGTENGLVIGGNRKGKTSVEKLPSRYEAHTGPVYALQRNPAFLKNFLTVGDWTARVWSEDCRDSAIIWTYAHRVKLTDGCWNPIRFSLMMLAQWDGCLSCWDLLRRQSAPVFTAQLCDEPLTRIRPHEQGRLVACGSRKGSIYLAELSENLGTADKNDKQLLTHILERENKRERILEARMREIRLKMKQEAGAAEPAAAAAAAAVEAAGAGAGGAADRDLADAAADYMQIVQEMKNA